MEKRGIKITDHIGTWYVIDEGFHNGSAVYLLEHEKYGEDAAALIVDSGLNVIMADVHNGLSDLD